MNWFWLNVPLDVVFFGAWVGIPTWLVLRHPDRDPKPLASAQARQTGPVGPQAALIPPRSERLAGV